MRYTANVDLKKPGIQQILKGSTHVNNHMPALNVTRHLTCYFIFHAKKGNHLYTPIDTSVISNVSYPPFYIISYPDPVRKNGYISYPYIQTL